MECLPNLWPNFCKSYKQTQNPWYSLAVLLAYLALLERPRMIGCLFMAFETFRRRALGSGTEAFRTELLDSVLRFENPVLLVEDSVSLGVLKEPVLFLGRAKTSNRESFLLSWAPRMFAEGLTSEFWDVRSVSVPSLSEASPKRARRSIEALVGFGAERLLERAKALCTLDLLVPSFWRGTVYFL